MPHNVEEHFLAAYHRLAARAPLNDRLKAKVAQGKPLIINQFTVALEAGHSRTMLSKRAPGYERICALLYPHEQPRPDVRIAGSQIGQKTTETKAEKIARLDAENVALAYDRDRFATCAAEAYAAIRQLRNDIRRLERELERRTNSNLCEDIAT